MVNLAPIVILLLVVFIGLCRVLFRSAFTYDPERVAALMALDEREVIRDRGLLLRSGIVLVAVMVGFVAHSALHIEPSMVALLGAGALVALSKLDPPEFLEEVEWPTLVFFMGLFVMVGALVEVGVIGRLGALLTEAVDSDRIAGVLRAVGAPPCCPASWTTSRMWRPSPHWSRPWSTPATVSGTRPCGGRWPSEPTSRERDRRRGQRERRRHRHRRPRRSPDHVLAVHQVRLGRRRGHDRSQLAVPVSALILRSG